MDDGEVDSPSSGAGLLDLHGAYSHFLDDSGVMEDDWNTLIGTQICSHKHICNPTTGPDNTHTHTCEHTHTHTISSGDDEKLTKKRRPTGNKEAVRKYREKQKAVKVNLEVRNAELEKENQRIPEILKENLKLRRKLQEQGPRQDVVEHLISENKRLRALLSQLRRAIDSELEGLEDVSYKKLLFGPTAATKVDRGGGGAYLPGGSRCAAPVPCFSSRPVTHHSTLGGGEGGLEDDLEQLEGSLGWHAECEVGKTVMVCPNPQAELEDSGDQDGPDGFAVEMATPSGTSNGGTSSSGSQRQQPLMLPSKSPATTALRKKSKISGPGVETGAAHQHPQQPGGVRCPVAALPVPCFNNASRASIPSSSTDVGPQQQQIERWQENCDLNCGDAEMTADSCTVPASSPTPPEDVTQSGSANILLPEPQATLAAPASKKGRMEPSNSHDLFPPGCLFSDNVTPGTEAAAVAAVSAAENPWNHDLLSSVVRDTWLEECDIIDGVCQAHLANAIQGCCFGASDEGGRHDSASSRSTATMASLPPTG